MKNNDPGKTARNTKLDNELYESLLRLPKFFKDAVEHEFVYGIPGYGEKKKYQVIADQEEAEYRTEAFTQQDYIGRNPDYPKRNLVLISNSSKAVLCRFDLGNCPPHTNPDGTVVIGNHMHLYEEINASSIAYQLPPDIEFAASDITAITKKFLEACNIDYYDNVIFEESLL